MAQPKTRSPIREAPRRQAGESLRDQIAYETNYLAYSIGFGAGLLTCALVGAGAVLFIDLRAVALIMFAVAGVSGIVIGVLSYRRAKREVPNRILGLDGELSVAESLGELERAGYRVFHDIPPKRDGDANIDHVVVGESGIFVVETKTRSKPLEGNPAIEFDGEAVRLGDGPPDPRPIRQVRAIAGELERSLSAILGEAVRVQRVVLYPKWFVTSSAQNYRGPVWVLNPGFFVNGLLKYGKRAPWVPSDLSRVVAAVEQHARSASLRP